jgi:hypothetical protein
MARLFYPINKSKFVTLETNNPKLIMQLPKFVIADNSDFPEDIFIIHLDFPRFLINLKDDEVEFLEDLEGEDETELEAEMEHLITLAGEFYDKEMKLFEE